MNYGPRDPIPMTLGAFDATPSRYSEAARYADDLTAALIAAQEDLERDFLLAANVGDMGKPAFFAPMVSDRATCFKTKRWVTVGEVFGDVLAENPELRDETSALLCELAMSGNEKAKALVKRMARTFAKQNSEAAL